MGGAMNVFGAFTFGALIKTFLPGFVWLTAVVIALFEWPAVGTFIDRHESLAAVLSIPASILLGLLSNILVFMGVNDLLVRYPVRSNNKLLFDLYDALCAQMKAKCWASIDCPNPDMEKAFNQEIDPELLMLHKVGVSTLAYIREQYWFHLEFQLNLLLSCIGITVVTCFYLYKIGAFTGVAIVGIAILVVFLLTWLLISAARKNYQRHIAKMASMMAAVLCPPSQETSAAAKS
jgi:uncharacterized membrane protein